MALQTSGQISLNDVNTELGNASGTSLSMGSTAVRTLFGISSGEIQMSDGYGASGSIYSELPSGYTELFDSSTYGAGTATSFKNLMSGTTACYGWASNCYTLDSNGVHVYSSSPLSIELWFPVSGGNSTLGLNGQTYFMLFSESGLTTNTTMESGRTSSESMVAASVTNDQSPFNVRFDDDRGNSFTAVFTSKATYSSNAWYASSTTRADIHTYIYTNMIAAGHHIRVSWDG